MNNYLGAIRFDWQSRNHDYGYFETRPMNGSIGAEISGIDLSVKPSDGLIEAIEQAMLNHLVLFFDDQNLTPDQLVNLGRRFGELHINPFAAGLDGTPEVMVIRSEENDTLRFAEKWHSDLSWETHPSMGSILFAVNIPPSGGDTLFASMYLSYDTLSDELKQKLDGKKAIHSALQSHGAEAQYSDVPDEIVIHPVIRTHPITKRKSLFVNEYFTTGIVDMEQAESQPLLEQLYQHAVRPDFCCRYRWKPGSLAFWDNRCTQHYATNDYAGHSRLMHRVTMLGDRPF